MSAFGVLLFLTGVAIRLGALLLGSKSKQRWAVFFFRAFQRSEDYTPTGWRWYTFGSGLALLGFVLAVVSAKWFE